MFREKREERREGSGRWMKRKREKGSSRVWALLRRFFFLFVFRLTREKDERKGGNVNFIPDNVELSVVGSIIFGSQPRGRDRRF